MRIEKASPINPQFGKKQNSAYEKRRQKQQIDEKSKKEFVEILISKMNSKG